MGQKKGKKSQGFGIWKKISQTVSQYLQVIRYYFARETSAQGGLLHSKQISQLTKIKDPEAKKWGPTRLTWYWEFTNKKSPKALIGRAKVAQ